MQVNRRRLQRLAGDWFLEASVLLTIFMFLDQLFSSAEFRGPLTLCSRVSR
jgi:hypothetical protein